MFSGKTIFMLVTVAVCIFAAGNGYAQIRVDTTRSAEFLVQDILIGQGILVGNVTSRGAPYAIALFTDSSAQVGIKEGILLSTGNVYYSIGPNKSPRSGWASNTPGDEDLNKITRGKTYDAAVLEFDFIASSEMLSFNFVFASEEYQEYVGSKFNDVFGFFLTGPNADHVNLATLPDGKTPITINSVNHEKGKMYYVDNPYYNTSDPFIWDVRKRKVVKNKKYLKKVDPPRYDVQFDGFTVVLQARYTVFPDEIYHIKMAIADVSDGILDSGVFLEAGSFRSSGEIFVTLDETEDRFDKVQPDQKIPLMVETNDVTAKASTKGLGVIAENINYLPEPEMVTPDFKIVNIEFAFDSYEIPDSFEHIIHSIYKLLESNPDIRVEVIGHTDNRGSGMYNMQLSKKRSDTVIKHLFDFGVKPDRITSRFMGETAPVDSNNTEKGRARNRRVEFMIKRGKTLN